MAQTLPITTDSEICAVLSCLPDKFVVDFANGIDIARDHLLMQNVRGSFSSRLYDGLTGQGVRRQTAINSTLCDGIEASLRWLIDLSESLVRSNLALARVNDRVNTLKHDVATVADFSGNTRRELDALALRLEERCDSLIKEITRIDYIQRAQLNLDQVFNKWRAGRYRSFSLSGRCYAALEELRWGAFGDFCRSQSGSQRREFISDLANRAIAQLSVDAQSNSTQRINTQGKRIRCF